MLTVVVWPPLKTVRLTTYSRQCPWGVLFLPENGGVKDRPQQSSVVCKLRSVKCISIALSPQFYYYICDTPDYVIKKKMRNKDKIV